LHFIFKTEEHLAISGDESVRVRRVAVFIKSRQRQEQRKIGECRIDFKVACVDWGVQNISKLFVQVCDLWPTQGISVKGQKIEFPIPQILLN
jgi:hypothetical protein